MLSSSLLPTCLSAPPSAGVDTTVFRHPFNHLSHSPPPPPPLMVAKKRNWLDKSLLPMAASMAVLLSPYPAHAGFLSGFSGLESIPGPELPKIDSLAHFNEENQKRYAENDAKFKESPILKELLEKSKLNKEK